MPKHGQGWYDRCWLIHMPKHGQGWYGIADSMAAGVHLLALGSGWEVTCDVLSMRIPGSQKKGKECSAV